MKKLSLCLIARDEAQNISRCLGSVKNLVDEMIVLDTGSVDNTIQIAKDIGALVYQFEWCNDFSAARNEALKYINSEWVLVLDADEVLNPSIIDTIQNAINDPQTLVINLMRHEVDALQSPYSLVSRLFRHHHQIYFTRPYHAIIDDSVIQLLKTEPHWQIKTISNIAIEHYGYQTQVIQSQHKLTKAQIAMEGYIKTHPNDPYVCNKLGALYTKVGKIKDGIALLARGIETLKQKQKKYSETPEPSLLYELYYHLANAYLYNRSFDKAINNYQMAIAQPILPKLKLGANSNLASLLVGVKEYSYAEKLYTYIIGVDPNFILAYYNLGLCYRQMGKIPEAINIYHKAIALNPNLPEVHQSLGAALLSAGQVQKALDSFRKAIKLHTPNNPNEANHIRQELKTLGLEI